MRSRAVRSPGSLDANGPARPWNRGGCRPVRTARGARGLWRTARRLRESGARVAYLAQGSARSGALVALAGVPERVGFQTSGGGRWFCPC